MDQERIGKFIRETRQKEGLTQEKFAQKYGVTYQAVSKWENGKNIPDIGILKQICDDYHLDFNNLFDKNYPNRKKEKKKIMIVGMIIFTIMVIGICFFWLFNQKNNDFSFKKIAATCDNFNVYGSIAYNDSKTSIYISNIIYCGENDENEYKELECTLYETDDTVKTKISSYSYQEQEPISLDEFLEKVNFNVEHYSKTCKMYKNNTLYLEIEATNTNDQIIFYRIPLQLEENCDE